MKSTLDSVSSLMKSFLFYFILFIKIIICSFYTIWLFSIISYQHHDFPPFIAHKIVTKVRLVLPAPTAIIIIQMSIIRSLPIITVITTIIMTLNSQHHLLLMQLHQLLLSQQSRKCQPAQFSKISSSKYCFIDVEDICALIVCCCLNFFFQIYLPPMCCALFFMFLFNSMFREFFFLLFFFVCCILPSNRCFSLPCRKF